VAIDIGPVAEAPETSERYRRLRVFNIAVGVLLAAEALYMLLASNDLAIPVTASYLRTDPVAVTAPTLPQVVFSLRIRPAVAFFLALAARPSTTCWSHRPVCIVGTSVDYLAAATTRGGSSTPSVRRC
jgi:hypothetical protein